MTGLALSDVVVHVTMQRVCGLERRLCEGWEASDVVCSWLPDLRVGSTWFVFVSMIGCELAPEGLDL